MGIFPGEGSRIMVPPLSIVGSDGAVRTDHDDGAINEMKPVEERCCL